MHSTKHPARRDGTIGPYIVDYGCNLGRPRQNALIGGRGLNVLNEIRRVNRDDVATKIVNSEWPDDCNQTAIWHFTRLQELNRRATGPGIVAVHAIQQLKTRAIRVHRKQVNRIVTAHVIPACKCHAAIT